MQGEGHCCGDCNSFYSCMNQCILAQMGGHTCEVRDRPIPKRCPADGCGGYSDDEEEDGENE
ncbi:hypothetical protein FACS189479_05490 [Spirochaetia bacterium]|nr:hypothetical protein FACS189479_05490 [Spirochaetia bacterium]